MVQWIIAAGTAIFPMAHGSTRAALDLFERRYAIYETARKAVGRMTASSQGFDQEREVEFLTAMEQAYFFFGDDVDKYLNELWSNIAQVLGLEGD